MPCQSASRHDARHDWRVTHVRPNGGVGTLYTMDVWWGGRRLPIAADPRFLIATLLFDRQETPWPGIRGYGHREPNGTNGPKPSVLHSPSVGVEDEPWEGAVFVAVASVSFAPVQLNENLIACIQMKDDTVAGVVVTLVLVLGDGAGPDLEEYVQTRQKKNRLMSPVMHTSFCLFCRGNLRADLKRVLENLDILLVSQWRGSGLIRCALEKG